MSDSGKAHIQLESVQGSETAVHLYVGEWFRKPRSIYIRYSESPEGRDAEETKVMLRYTSGELLLRRTGTVTSEQLFVPGKRCTGVYKSAPASFALETETSRLRLHEAEADEAGLPQRPPFTLEWEYGLYVEQQMSGRFHIRLHIQGELHL